MTRKNEPAARLPFIPEVEQLPEDYKGINNQNEVNEVVKYADSVPDNDSYIEQFPDINPAIDTGYGWVIVFSSLICLIFVDGFGTSFSLLINPTCSPRETNGCIGTSELGDDFGTQSRTLLLFPHGIILGLNLFVGPFVSALSSGFPFRYVAMTGAFVFSISCFFASIASNYYLFLSLTIFIGIGSGLIYLPAISIVGQWFHHKRNLAVGITLCGVGLGELIGGFLMTWATEKYGWRFVMLIMSFCALQLMVISALFRPIETHTTILTINMLKRKESEDRKKLIREEKAKRIEEAAAKKREKRDKRKALLDEREAEIRAREKVNLIKKIEKNRGTIMTKIIEEKNRQRTTSIGSLDGVMINQDNELIGNPNSIKKSNLISKISGTTLRLLESRFGQKNLISDQTDQNTNNQTRDQDDFVSKLLVDAVNSENKLIRIMIPEEPIPIKVPLDKIVKDYIQSQIIVHSNKMKEQNVNSSIQTPPIRIKKSISLEKGGLHDESKSTPTSLGVKYSHDFDESTEDDKDSKNLNDQSKSSGNNSLNNSMTDLNASSNSLHGVETTTDDEYLHIQTLQPGQSISLMAAEQILDPETKALIKTQILQEIICAQDTTEGISKSSDNCKRNENVLASILSSKISNGFSTSAKSSRSQKSHIHSSLFMSISTGMSGGALPLKVVDSNKYRNSDLLAPDDDNDDQEDASLVKDNPDPGFNGNCDTAYDNHNSIMANHLEEVEPFAQHMINSDHESLNFSGSMQNNLTCRMRLQNIGLFLREILNFKVFTSLRFILLAVSSFFGIFGLVIPILYVPDLVNLIPSANHGHITNRGGYLLATIGISNILGRIIANFYISRFYLTINSADVNLISLILSGLIMLIVPFISNYYYLLIILLIIFGIFSTIFMSLKNILVFQLIGIDGNVTNILGYLLLFQGVGLIFATLTCGLFFDYLHSQFQSLVMFSSTYAFDSSTARGLFNPPYVMFYISSVSFALASLIAVPLTRMSRNKFNSDLNQSIEVINNSQTTLTKKISKSGILPQNFHEIEEKKL